MNQRAKILLVDDDSVILKATRLTLEAAGYEVSTAATGAEGLRLAETQPPDLALLDRVLPDLDGIEVCRRLKTNPATVRVFVALLSAMKISGDDQADGLEIGADDYIVRPISNRELLARVQALLRIKRTEEALRASEARYKSLLETQTEVIARSDMSGRLNFVNDAYCQTFGQSREALVGEVFLPTVIPEDQPVALAVLQDIQSPPYRKESETRHFTPGGIRWFLWDNAAVVDESGQITELQGTGRDITARKLAEETLRVFSARQEAILAAVPDIIMEVDNHKVYTWANQAGLEFFGEDVIGQEAAFYFEGEQDTYSVVQPIFNGNENLIYVESWQRRRDGQKRLLAWWCRVLKDEGGNVQGAISSALDITVRKLAEESLRENERRLREAQEMAHLGFWRWDIKRGDVEWSEEVFKIFGLDPQEFTPHIDSILALSPWPEDHQRDQELIKRAIETHSPGSYEQKFLRPDQSIGHYYSTFQGNYAKNGDLISIVGTVLDITARKLAEEELAASEVRYRRLFEAARDGILILDAETGLIVDANPFLSDLLGFSPETFLNKEVWELGFFKDIYSNKAKFLELQQKGYVRYEDLPLETADGRRIEVEFVSNVYQVNHHTVIQCNIRDITARKQTEAKINAVRVELQQLLATADQSRQALLSILEDRERAAAQLRATLAEKEVLLREVHHRVKNNMQAIIALAEMRLEQVSEASTRQMLKEFQEQARTMSLVYEQLYQSDNLAQVDMPVYLENLAFNVLAAFGENRDIDLRLEVEPVSLDVSTAMPGGLIVNELLTNALKHAFPPDFSAPKRITVGLKTAGETTVFWVSDNGVGLPPGLDWRQGKSLGLRLVNLWATHQLGGRLEVDTCAGGGVTFKVTLGGR